MTSRSNWSQASLFDLVDIHDSMRVPLNSRQRASFSGPYPYYGANGIIDYVSDYIFDGEYVLIAEDGGHFDNPSKSVAIKVDGRFWVNNHAHVVSARHGVSNAYLVYALKTVDWMNHVTGTTRPKLTQASLKDITIPITSTAEQMRLVEQLNAVTEATSTTYQILAEATKLVQAYKISIIKAGLSGALSQQMGDEGTIKHWMSVRLADYVHSFDYGSSAKSSKSGQVPVLRMGNIQGGDIDWSDLVFTSNMNEINKYLLRDGDVLFNRTNSPELVGKTALFRGERPAIFAGYLIRIICRSDLLPSFLTYILNGESARAYFAQVRSDGVNQSNISASKLAELRFDLPCLDEQRAIVSRLDSSLAWADRISLSIQSSIGLLNSLQRELIAKGIGGELTLVEPGDDDVAAMLTSLTSEPTEVRAERLALKHKGLNRRPAAVVIGDLDKVDDNKTKVTDLHEGLLLLGGEAAAVDLWEMTGLPIEAFYKRLRTAIDAGYIREGQRKGQLESCHETR